jgi:transposase InsO family protein
LYSWVKCRRVATRFPPLAISGSLRPSVYKIGNGSDAEILNFLDDHSRCLLACVAHPRVTGPAVITTFRAALAHHGVPASVLSDNGMVFTTRFAGGRGAGRGGRNTRNGFETELARHGIVQKNSPSSDGRST